MLATQIEVSDGTLNIINVGIEFFNQTDISVSLDQSEPLVLGVDYVWATGTSIQFLPTVGVPGGLVPNGVEVILRRDTKNDAMYNIYDGGAPFSRVSLDENFEQLLRLSQEFSEGLGLDGLRNDFNMNGYRIVNVGPPVDDGDAANKAYVDAGDAALMQGLNRTIRAPSPEIILPLPAAIDRVDKLLSFDALGNPIAVLPSSGSATDLEIRLADTVDPAKGAGMIGYLGNTVRAWLDRLSNAVGATNGAAMVGRSVEGLDGIVTLLTTPTAGARHISVASYHNGWAASTLGPLGRSVWAWDATEPKTNHNGFDKISPTVPWTGAFATMNAFQAGTGETAPGTNGCWVRIHGANDLVSWGCLPAVGTDNFNPISRAIAWAYTNKRRLRANSGTFGYSATLDLSYPGLCMRGVDMMGTVFKYTGGGRCMDILGTRPNAGAFSIGIELSDFTVEGNANVIDIIRIRINHAVLRNINLREAAPTGCGLRVEGVVLGHFENVVCSTGRQLMTSRPLRGVILDADPTDLRRASANLWTNLIVEGMLEDGIHLIAADTQVFNGGTSENNDGLGVFVPAGCRVNTFNGVGFENRGYADVFDDGQMNRFINCYGIHKIYHGPNSSGHYVRGGYWQNVEGDVNAKHPDIDDIQFNFLPLILAPVGTFVVPSVTAHVGRNINNVQAGVQYYHKKTAVAVTPTSGILITNSTGIDVDYYVTGGTVSAITEYRTGSPFLSLPLSGKFRILPEDGLVITFTVAPTVTQVPRS